MFTNESDSDSVKNHESNIKSREFNETIFRIQERLSTLHSIRSVTTSVLMILVKLFLISNENKSPHLNM